MAEITECRFCSSPPVVVVALDEGCLCHPEDREQALCEHHLRRATPLGEMKLVRDLTVEQVFARRVSDA